MSMYGQMAVVAEGSRRLRGSARKSAGGHRRGGNDARFDTSAAFVAHGVHVTEPTSGEYAERVTVLWHLLYG